MEEKIFDLEFFNKLNTLKLGLKLRLDKGMGGMRKSGAKGSSVEFSDFREYILGDDIRRIDWNAYGRMDKLFVKLFMEEKEGLFNIFLDASKSMDFGESNKSIQARRIIGALSYMILDNLDRITLTILKEDNIVTTKSMTGRQSFQRILTGLEDTQFEGETNLVKGILKQPFKSKGVAIIISDFFDTESIEDAIRYMLYKKQEIILIQVLSPEEINPFEEGCINLIDSETTDNMKVTMTTQVLKVYKQTFNNFTNNLIGLSKKYAFSYIMTRSDETLDKLIFESFYKSRILS